MKNHKANNRRGFIDPITLAVLGLGALGVLQYQDTKTNKAQDATLASHGQAIRQNANDINQLGGYVASEPWAPAKPSNQPATASQVSDWRSKCIPQGNGGI